MEGKQGHCKLTNPYFSSFTLLVRYTHLKGLPLLLLDGADVAEVPLLRRVFLKEPHAQKLILYTQDTRLSSLS